MAVEWAPRDSHIYRKSSQSCLGHGWRALDAGLDEPRRLETRAQVVVRVDGAEGKEVKLDVVGWPWLALVPVQALG